MATILIEKNAIVSQGASLCAGTHDIDDPWFPLIAKPITIGTNAWVAAEAFIGPGVNVGKNAVVGARAVLFRDAQDCGVYIGNPARYLKTRIMSETNLD
jgi:putative colanic acid biosynthesis acetyltransferase WcaF